jgi:hypothetical protein
MVDLLGLLLRKTLLILFWNIFEDTKGVIRIRKMKDRKHNDQKKKERTKKSKQRSTKHTFKSKT